MARTTHSPVSKRRHKKFLKAAKGYVGARHRLYTTARETVERAWEYATEHRKLKKRDFRTLWTTRISAGVRLNDMSYSKFMGGLKRAKIALNRKVLSELAQNDMPAFQELIKIAKQA
jgi:large subunit ribosomal protein L20